MRISKKWSIGEFAAFVASYLKSRDIETELTGGAVVSIYTNNKYHSDDADFISPAGNQKIAKALLEIGFKKKGKNFTHPETDYFVEFPTGPLAIGGQQATAEAELTMKGNKLKLLSPTQCVMDRLAAYFHWNDMQALDQALWVAQNHPVKIEKIRKWSQGEGHSEKFNIFFVKLRSL